MSLAEGRGIGFRGVVGGGFSLWKIQEKGKGVGEGGGWGGDSQRNHQVNAQALSKLPSSKLPFSFSPNQGVFKHAFVGNWKTRDPAPSSTRRQ